MAHDSDSLTPGVDAGDVIAARDLVLAFMRPLATRDWTSPIPDLEWDCEVTLRHMIRAQTIYSAHLATRAKKRLRLSREVDPGLSVANLNHRFGPTAGHFIDDYYHAFLEQLDKALATPVSEAA